MKAKKAIREKRKEKDGEIRGGVVDVVLRGQATAGVLGLGQKEWQKAASVRSH